jgi:hypothetical protein
MRGLIVALTVVLFMTTGTENATAWEFAMTGEFEYRVRYYSRLGPNDLFGDTTLQDRGIDPAGQSWSANPGWINTAAGTYSGTSGLGPGNALTYGVQSIPAPWIGFAGPNIYGDGWARPYILGSNIVGPLPVPLFGPHVSGTALQSGVFITRGGFSRWGSDALLNDMRLTVRPVISLNEAMRIEAVLTFGGLRHAWNQRSFDGWGMLSTGSPPFERYYMSQSSDAAYTTASLPSVEQLRATVRMPLGVLSVGIKDFPVGTGATLARNTRSESLLLAVPYGPFRMLGMVWLARGAVGGRIGWNTIPDGQTKPSVSAGAFVTYDSAGMNVTFGGLYHRKHADLGRGDYYPQAVAEGFSQDGPVSYDNTNFLALAALKYNNGMLFANAEYACAGSDTHYTASRFVLPLVQTYRSPPPRYVEGYHVFAEAGIVMGAKKMALMYGLASGPTLNNNNLTKVYEPLAINYQVLEPYGSLMFPLYAGGNNAFNPDGTGEMADAYAFGARVDYALAANVNVFSTVLWAHRLERAGTYAGTYLATTDVNGLADPAEISIQASRAINAARAQAWKNSARDTGGTLYNPYVDDGFIGWETMSGMSWKLLEGLTVEGSYSWWQPGAWFDQAYRAFTGKNAAGLRGQGLLMGRSAILGMNISFLMEF